MESNKDYSKHYVIGIGSIGVIWLLLLIGSTMISIQSLTAMNAIDALIFSMFEVLKKPFTWMAIPSIIYAVGIHKEDLHKRTEKLNKVIFWIGVGSLLLVIMSVPLFVYLYGH